jgi:uncharacterized protein YutE (UPF0331/DUF86 family)
MPNREPQPALQTFWEEADLEAASEHPLERELQHQLDVLSRCLQLLVDERATVPDEALDTLRRQHAQQEQIVESLRRELARCRAREH